MIWSTSFPKPGHSRCAVYCDFDGTIALEDVTDIILSRLASREWLDIEAEWNRRVITSKECMARQVTLIRGGWEAIKAVLRDVQLDPSFATFATWCSDSGIPLMVVSDGLDRVIQYLLWRDEIPVDGIRANQLVCKGEELSLKFPVPSAENCQSGVCKCRVISEMDSADVSRVVIGDGRSDFCWAQKADLVFAKSKLLDYCRTKKIPCHSFHNFNEIRRTLETKFHGASVPEKREQWTAL